MPDFPEITEGLVIHPGDTVIFTVGPNELDTPEQVEDYYRRIREVMPDGVKVILTSTRPTVIRRDASLGAYEAGEEAGWHRGFDAARRYPKGGTT